MSALNYIPKENELEVLKWLKAYGDALLNANEAYNQHRKETDNPVSVSPLALSSLDDQDMHPIQRQFYDLYCLREMTCEKLKGSDYPVLNKASIVHYDKLVHLQQAYDAIKDQYPDDFSVSVKRDIAIIQTSSASHDFCLDIMSQKLQKGREKFTPLDESKVPSMISGMSTPKETVATLKCIADRITILEKDLENNVDCTLEV